MSDVFVATIWPSAFAVANDIECEIKKQYKISKHETYKFNKENFKKFLFGIYKPDKTPSSRIKRKHKVMAKFPLFIRLIEIYVSDPTILPHKKTRLLGTYYCKNMKTMKRQIRKIFIPRMKMYTHDTIIHVSDNEKQNKKSNKLAKKYGSLNG